MYYRYAMIISFIITMFQFGIILQKGECRDYLEAPGNAEPQLGRK